MGRHLAQRASLRGEDDTCKVRPLREATSNPLTDVLSHHLSGMARIRWCGTLVEWSACGCLGAMAVLEVFQLDPEVSASGIWALTCTDTAVYVGLA